MSDRFLRYVLLFTVTVSVGFGGSFSFHDYLQKRFHPETVQERDVESLDQHIRDNKLVLDIQSFLALVLKNSTDIRLTQLDVYTAANAITGAKAPFDAQLLLSFNALRSVESQ